MVHPVRIRAMTVSVIHILSRAHLGAGDGYCIAQAATLQKRVKSSSTSVYWDILCFHLSSEMSPPQLHCSQIKDSPSWQRALSQTHEAHVCRIYARVEPPLCTSITRTSKVWQDASGNPWWTHWSEEFSHRKNEELLFCRSSIWDFTLVHWWTDAASSQLMTELKIQPD